MMLNKDIRRDATAERFLELERDFTDAAILTGSSDLELLTEAGELTIAAYQNGWLENIKGMAERVAWHTSDEPVPMIGEAVFIRCPSNLWTELVGSHVVIVEGEKIRDACAGILQQLFPEAFTPVNQRADKRDVVLTKRMATACRVLAGIVRTPMPQIISITQTKAATLLETYGHPAPNPGARKQQLIRWAKKDPSIKVADKKWDQNKVMSFIQSSQ